MSSAVAELDASLQAMLSLKPPGVSGSRINAITALCVDNVQSESVLIQKLYTHFKRAPPTHKLGVLYVVDSVTRKWAEQAKSAGQPINCDAPDGTYGAGVFKVKDLLPAFMTDIVQTAPDDQKEKIRKLIEIWEKGQTFPTSVLAPFKERLTAPLHNLSTTPPGSPPVHLHTLGLTPTAVASATAPPARDAHSILAALTNLSRQNNAFPANTATPPQNNFNSVSNTASNQVHPAYAQNLVNPSPAPVNVQAPAAYTPYSQAPINGVQNYANNQSIQFPPVPPPVPGALDPALQQQFILIKALSDQGIPPDQIAGIVAAMGGQGLLPMGAFPPPPPQFAAQQNQNHNQNQNGENHWAVKQEQGMKQEESRDRHGYQSPPSRFRRRSRSRSPTQWNQRDGPNNRGREDQYERGSPGGRNRGEGRGRARGSGNEYRQRSPPRRGRSPSPIPDQHTSEKWVEHDETVPRGNIKVLSRTLFVGGVTMPEHELRRIIEQYGRVQTCIVQKEKRHAFVKMYTRIDAIKAKDGMEENRNPDSQLRTKWGVGFGPRECSDYQTGVSVIPITALTDADRKWMLSAANGGTGGKPIVSGMVCEEPDIEIGQGVSSKAISRRMQTDKSGSNGPKSSRDYDDDGEHGGGGYGGGGGGNGGGGRGRFRVKDEENGVQGPPAMPSIPAFGGMPFPFPMPTLPNGMPMLPPNFLFPGAGQNGGPNGQPAPGRS